MARQALGLIETVGLVAAIEAADAAVKAADVKLIGYELTRGGGLTVVKIIGDVAAVQAAVQAAGAAAGRVGKVVATHVIPRPHEDSALLIETRETVGQKRGAPCRRKDGDKGSASSAECLQSPEGETVVQEKGAIGQGESHEKGEEAVVAQERVEGDGVTGERTPTCNLCNDPACPRKKGEPRSYCLHYGGEG